MFFERLFTRLLFSMFIGSLGASILVLVIPEITFVWLMIMLWSWSILSFFLLSRYAKKKKAVQEAKFEALINSKSEIKSVKGRRKFTPKKKNRK